MKNLKIAIEYDDMSPRNHALDSLEKIKEHLPNFKCTVFTVPWEIRFGGYDLGDKGTPITDPKAARWVETMKAYSDWIEIALHGFTHMPHEFADLSYEAARKRIITGSKMLQNLGLTYTKIFKAPYWELSREGKQAAEDLGYRVVEDGYYQWNLKDNLAFTDSYKSDTALIGHGHIQNIMDNGAEETKHRILALPTDTEFKFLSEVLNCPKGIFAGEYDNLGPSQ